MRFSHKHGSFTINGNGRVFPGSVCFRPLLQLSLIDCVCFSNFTADIIEKIIVSLNPNKAHGHDNINIRMLKICGNTICKPLELIFKQALTTGVFPSEWKKGNIVPCYKKGDKQNIKKYRPVSLLPICGKFFERLIFNEMFIIFWLTIS